MPSTVRLMVPVSVAIVSATPRAPRPERVTDVALPSFGNTEPVSRAF